MQIGHQILTNPVARGLNIVGDRWTILIMRDAFLGRQRFSEFRTNTGIARGTLSNRLEALVAEGLLYKKPYSESPKRFDYKLTDKGLSLYPWALLIWQWESRWTDHQEAGVPSVLWHAVDGSQHELQPQCVCRHCREPLRYDDVKRVVTGDGSSVSADEVSEKFGNQRRTRSQVTADADHALGHIIDIIGDRWTTLILAAAFIGLRRYDDFQQQLGIATNILADRLKMLLQMEVLERKEYQSNPPRYQYELTEKGKSLYPQTMAVRQWVLDCLPEAIHPFKLVHKNCGQDLSVDVVCGHCQEKPGVGNVTFDRHS
ncbi:MAG: winged helix-turn-helix transcriptional regulator [Cellvibrionaceae bacterium]